MGITQGVCWGLLRGVLRSDIGQRGVFLVEVKMRSSSTGPYYGAICSITTYVCNRSLCFKQVPVLQTPPTQPENCLIHTNRLVQDLILPSTLTGYFFAFLAHSSSFGSSSPRDC